MGDQNGGVPPPRRPARRHGRIGLVGLLALAGLASVLAACGHTPGPTSVVTLAPPSAPSSSPPSSSTSRPPPPKSTPSTTYRAAAPQASPDGAAARLIGAWAAGDRPTARRVATPGAVATLFAVAYPGQGLAVSRGCSSTFVPIVCTYGPPGGASPTDPVFEIAVSQSAGRWYVSSVRTLS
jgi:hypothetical protein